MNKGDVLIGDVLIVDTEDWHIFDFDNDISNNMVQKRDCLVVLYFSSCFIYTISHNGEIKVLKSRYFKKVK